jgi:hypothetical protein
VDYPSPCSSPKKLYAPRSMGRTQNCKGPSLTFQHAFATRLSIQPPSVTPKNFLSRHKNGPILRASKLLVKPWTEQSLSMHHQPCIPLHLAPTMCSASPQAKPYLLTCENATNSHDQAPRPASSKSKNAPKHSIGTLFSLDVIVLTPVALLQHLGSRGASTTPCGSPVFFVRPRRWEGSSRSGRLCGG